MSKMNLMLIGSCTIAVFALTACATSNTSPSGEAVAAAPAVTKAAPVDMKTETSQVVESTEEADPNRRICKRQSVPGSNMKKRVCGTASEWEEQEKLAREIAASTQGAFRSQGGSN